MLKRKVSQRHPQRLVTQGQPAPAAQLTHQRQGQPAPPAAVTVQRLALANQHQPRLAPQRQQAPQVPPNQRVTQPVCMISQENLNQNRPPHLHQKAV